MPNNFSLEDFSQLLALIYKGPLDATAWERMLAEFCKAFDSHAAVLILRSPSEIDPGMILISGIELSRQDPNYYSSGLYDMDPFVNLPPGEVVTLDQMVNREQLEKSLFFQKGMEPWDLYHIMGLDLRDPQGVNAGLRIARGHNAKPFAKQDRDKLTLLVPHLQQALELHNRLQRLDTERALFEGTVTRQALATLLIDDKRQLLKSNPVADRLLAGKEGLRVIDGAVQLERSAEHQHFKTLITTICEALRQQEPVIAQAMAVSRSSGQEPLNLVLRPAGHDNQGNPLLALFISDPSRKAEASQDILAQLFKLTPAEARLAMLLANGQSLDEAVAELGISRNTGRAHLRAIFAKTGVSQQTQLVSLLLKSVARLG